MPSDTPVDAKYLASSPAIRVGPFIRATGIHDVVLWLELTTPCCVQVDVAPLSAQTPLDSLSFDRPPESTIRTFRCQVHTVTVSGHYYATPHIEHLQPGTWYIYHIYLIQDDVPDASSVEASLPPLHCFRTMEHPGTAPSSSHELRLAYGSCRKYVAPQADALSALGRWLSDHWEQHKTTWPHLLLLIGDQIYADQPSDEILQVYPNLKNGASSFEDFALLYNYVWTTDADVRQALAVLPTYLIFDDHEITNDWNLLPQWCESMLAAGREQVIVDGLVAYWVYQGWGNLTPQRHAQHPLLLLMQEAQQHNEDIVEQLREVIRDEVLCKRNGLWHYEIPAEPPIFVVNARSERTTLFSYDDEDMCAPTRILSKQQMMELQQWMQQHDDTITVLVSSVPIILPPFIGFVEYLSGVRFLQRGVPPLRWLGRQLAHMQQRIAGHMSFDHWPAYAQTWQEMVQLLSQRRHDIVVLSGDVHFSYSIEARANRHARMLQLVSTPLENKLEEQSERLIVRQARITRARFGGLYMHMLSMMRADNGKPIPHGMLFQNAIAYVMLKQNRAGAYLVQQDYLSVVHGELQFVGRTKIPTS